MATSTLAPLLTLLAPLALAPVQDVAQVKEGNSGHRYDVTAALLDADPEAEKVELALAGIGIREKTFFAVNVYSFALYVEPEKTRELLAKWKAKSLKELQKDDAFYTSLIDDRIPKELRLRFCRNVDTEDVRSAFEDSLQPRVLAYLADKDLESSDEEKLAVVREFRALFSLDKVKKGCELRFGWHTGGKLHVSIDGKVQKVLTSRALCWALFDVYAGKDPISKSSKKKLIARLPDILAARAR